jgi:hypothetical protein
MTPTAFISDNRVAYDRGSYGEISYPYPVLTDFRKTGTSSILGFRSNSSC